MTSGQPLPRLGVVLLVGLSLAWGMNWPFIKIALREIQPWTYRAWSCLVAGLCLLALARMAGSRLRPARGELRRVAIAATLNVTLWHLLIAYGSMRMASGHTAVLAFTMPLWAAILGIGFLGEKLTGRIAAALALGLGGMVVLLSRDLDSAGDSPLGIGLVLCAAFVWALGTIYQKRQRWHLPTLALAGWQLALGTLPMFIILPFVEGLHVPQASALAWMATAYTTLIALVFAYFAWFKIVSLFPANIAAIGTLLTPVLGVISGAVALGEPFGWRELTALGLVGGALALVLINPAPRARTAAAPAD